MVKLVQYNWEKTHILLGNEFIQIQTYCNVEIKKLTQNTILYVFKVKDYIAY